MKDLYQYYFEKPDGTYYFVSPTLGVTTSPDPIHIAGSVVDWKALDLQWRRHERYHGIFRKQAPDKIRFAGDGAEILRWVKHYEGGTNAKCKFVIMILNPATLTYQLHGKFDVNFYIFFSSLHYVDTSLMEGGLSAKIRAYENTKFGIPLLNPAAHSEFKYIYMDGVEYHGKFTWVPPLGTQIYLDESSSDFLTMPLGFIENEGPAGVGVNNDGLGKVVFPGGDFDTAYMYKSVLPHEGRIAMNMPVFIENLSGTEAAHIEIEVQIRGPKPSVTPLTLFTNIYTGTSILPGASTIEYVTPSMSFYSFGAENYLIMRIRIINDTGGAGIAQLRVTYADVDGRVWLEYPYVPPPTVTRAISHWELFRKLVGKITGNEVSPPAASSLLTTDVVPDDVVWNLDPTVTYFTCGDALRELPTAAGIALGDTDPEIKTTFDELRRDAEGCNCAGIGIEVIDGEEKVVLEHLSHFYQRGVLIANLGDVLADNWQRYPYTDRMANNIKAGHKDPNVDKDQYNGRYEYIGEVNYQTTDERAQSDLDYVSPYVAAPYAITRTRINLENKQTTKGDTDNEVFKLQATSGTTPVAGYSPDPYLLDKDHTVMPGSGVDLSVSYSFFNIALTAGRKMRRLLPLLRSIFFWQTSPELKFQTATRNDAFAASMYSGTVVSESDNIDLTATTDEILFLPDVFEIEVVVPANLDALMSTNPYGEFAFRIWKGKQYADLRGFVLEAGINTSTRDARKFKLLLSPDTPAPYWA